LQENLCLDNSVILHMAQADQLPYIFDLVDDYNDGMYFDKTITKNNLREMVYMQSALLVKYKDSIIGGIAGFVLPCMFTNDLMFQIMFFYVRPKSRHLTGKIIDELELVVLPTKVTKIVFGVPIHGAKKPRSLIKYFRRRGYKPLVLSPI